MQATREEVAAAHGDKIIAARKATRDAAEKSNTHKLRETDLLSPMHDKRPSRSTWHWDYAASEANVRKKMQAHADVIAGADRIACNRSTKLELVPSVHIRRPV